MRLQTKRRWFLGAVFVLVLSLPLLAQGIAAQDAGTHCPLSQGYWKNTATWPVAEMVIGSQTYSQVELLILLNTPPQGNASLILAHQLIVAKLNLLNGSDALVVNGAVSQADALLAAYSGKLPYNVAPSSAEWQTMVALGGALDAYNNGLLTVNCALTPTPTLTPEATPEVTPEHTPEATQLPGGLPITIVIEGPVRAININIISIYDIDIQLEVEDPLLQIIRIGDIVHVEGNTQEVDGNIIIIVINIIIVNVDINIDTGEVWRDDGNCQNVPPPWAPAHGWRRRCEGGGNSGGGKKDKDDDDDD